MPRSIKQRKMTVRAGTLVGTGHQIIDTKGRVRWLPSDKDNRQRFIECVKRKIAAKKKVANQPVLPKTLTKPVVLTILKRMGFKEVKGASPQKFKHPKYGVVHLPSGKGIRTKAISIRRSFWRKIIRDYLMQGGKI